MKIFYDWEFEEDGIVIKPISLGMIDEDGNYLYVANLDYDQSKAPFWIKENVLNNLMDAVSPDWIHERNFSREILEFIESLPTGKIELIADYADYDHVCLAQRFGKMIDMPSVLPWVTYDLKQWCDDLGVEPPKQTTTPHNALNDAYYVRDCYKWLTENYKHPAWSK